MDRQPDDAPSRRNVSASPTPVPEPTTDRRDLYDQVFLARDLPDPRLQAISSRQTGRGAAISEGGEVAFASPSWSRGQRRADATILGKPAGAIVQPLRDGSLEDLVSRRQLPGRCGAAFATAWCGTLLEDFETQCEATGTKN